MKSSVEWIGGERFVSRSESGHAVVMDGDSESGCAPTPMEMLLMSAGSCASVDVVSIMEKARQDLRECQVQLSGQRADATPAVFAEIRLHFILRGENLSEKHAERAVRLSVEKYCSVASSLHPDIRIEHSFELQS